jgi:hypothetical protein
MQDPQSWQSSKFVRAAEGSIGSLDPSELAAGSRLIGDMYRGSKPAAICVQVSQWLLRRARVQRISARTRNLFPLGYCLVARKPTA